MARHRRRRRDAREPLILPGRDRAMYMRPRRSSSRTHRRSPPREIMLSSAVFVAMVVNVGSFFAIQPLVDLARNAANATALGELRRTSLVAGCDARRDRTQGAPVSPLRGDRTRYRASSAPGAQLCSPSSPVTDAARRRRRAAPEPTRGNPKGDTVDPAVTRRAEHATPRGVSRARQARSAPWPSHRAAHPRRAARPQRRSGPPSVGVNEMMGARRVRLLLRPARA